MIQKSGNKIGKLPNTVELGRVSRVLLMYSQALAGTDFQICSYDDKECWLHPDIPSTNGTTIFLPLCMDKYDSAEENFAWYKASATHQAAHIEFGTFDFSFEQAAGLFPGLQNHLSSGYNPTPADINRFFCLFDDRKLSADIFAMAEDMRIDYLLKREYPGIRNIYHRFQQEALERRLPPDSLPLREAFLETLMWMGLGIEPPKVPVALRGIIQPAFQVLQSLQSPEATVHDSAGVTLYLYKIVSAIPSVQLTAETESDTEPCDLETITCADIYNVGDSEEGASTGPGMVLPSLSSVEAELRDISDTEPFTLEDVKRFVNKEIDTTEVLRDRYPDSGFYVSELPTGAQSEEIPSVSQVEDGNKSWIITLADLQEEHVQSFLYDEWDFRAGCYLPRWCRVREIPLPQGNADFFKQTLSRNSSLAMLLRKQFEMLAPQRLKKLKKLQDGEEFDLDAVIESVMERKSGHMPSDKVYSKRIKIKRDIAVIFLIDMSASTAEIIRDDGDVEDYPEESGIQPAEGSAKRLRRRVVDVAKESIALMINVMELTGDCYGVYGFSSFGRDNVELRVVKGIEEPFSPAVESRIDSIRPLLSTRMGPAIRHAILKLDTSEAKTKIIFLVSDGYPQDRDYGADSEDKEYALNDTEMAFIEARRKNIVPFCLTIDATGYDFLKEMTYDIDHEVIRNVESLPRRLSILYKRLTS